MFFWSIEIYFRYRKSVLSDPIKQVYRKIVWYPIGMIFCWLFNFILTEVYSPSNHPLLTAVSMIFGILNGIFSALIFFISRLLLLLLLLLNINIVIIIIKNIVTIIKKN